MSKDPHINETLEKLEELAHGYQKALECSNQIISMKDRYIELCEMETALHRKENLRLQKIILWLTVCLGICAVVSLSRLFI
jgi:hypothetical protein